MTCILTDKTACAELHLFAISTGCYMYHTDQLLVCIAAYAQLLDLQTESCCIIS